MWTLSWNLRFSKTLNSYFGVETAKIRQAVVPFIKGMQCICTAEPFPRESTLDDVTKVETEAAYGFSVFLQWRGRRPRENPRRRVKAKRPFLGWRVPVIKTVRSSKRGQELMRWCQTVQTDDVNKTALWPTTDVFTPKRIKCSVWMGKRI